LNRRGFLAGMLAACAAPAIVKAGSLMRINPAIVAPEPTIVDRFGEALRLGEIGHLEGFNFVASPFQGVYQDWEGRIPAKPGDKVARWDRNGYAQMVVPRTEDFRVTTNETHVNKYIVMIPREPDWKDILING